MPLPLPRRRAGVILLVVITLLALFAVVGVSFVLFAQAEASAARTWRDAETLQRPDMDPELLLAYYLSQLVYDTDNPHSALRGHSLARTMYGKPGSNVPFSGTGRVHTGGADDFLNINYTQFGAALDPDQYGSPNAPFTYPDLNNVYLAAVRGSDGAVLLPSYQRANFGGTPTNRRHVLRPLPADHAGFPAQEDQGGDVKNLPGSPGTLIPGTNPPQYASNDSVWLDLGFPVMRGPDGRRFKPLFAALVHDLDNRVNVNVHGNILEPFGDPGGALNGGLDLVNGHHASCQGWGPWEVSLQRVLTVTEPVVGGTGNRWECRKLFTGDDALALRGRYDTTFWGQAGTTNELLANYTPVGKFYSRTNAEGDATDYDTFKLLADRVFPDLSGTGWENGEVTAARRNHQAIFNPLYPARTAYVPGNPFRQDRIFGASHLEALLRYGDTGSPALTSDLFLLCPQNFANAKTRRLVTTHSFDLAKPGVLPGLWSAPGAQPYQLAAGNQYPSAEPLSFPPAGASPNSGEFGADWKATTAALSRINLNRKLRDYPAINSTTARFDAANYAVFTAATAARQEMAREIFDRLRQVTGAADPASATGPDKDALRWLAQLAVNIVDYLDTDDTITPYNWTGDEWVFGTELPRLLVNEALCEIANDPTDPKTGGKATLDYKVKFYVELHNPLSTSEITDSGVARLQMVDPNNPGTVVYPCYKLAIATSPNNNLRQATNTRGNPDAGTVKTEVAAFVPEPAPATQPTLTASELKVVRGAGTATSGTAGSNLGYYVVGPKDDPDGSTGFPELTLRVKDQQIDGTRSSLVYESPVQTTDFAGLPKHTLLLRRLACPYMAPQDNPAQPNYNPFVTVDYLDNLPTQDAVQVDKDGTHAGRVPVDQRFAIGRKQPYAAALNQDQKPATALANQPQQTFFKRNLPGTTAHPYHWLTFMDRMIVSPMELLQVSAYKPHELTQQFVLDDGAGGLKPFSQRAPWFDPKARIYRLFEFLDAGMLVQATGPGTRVPGKININTVWDVETFHALADAHKINHFTDAQVETIFTKMNSYRTPTTVPGPNDKPFVSLAAPPSADATQYPLGMGIERTLLAPDPADTTADPNQRRRLFEPTPLVASARNHPYMKYELLNKIGNHVTTRSNVFAVWLTVGFFEVMDDSDPTRPPRLGGEVGRAENRHIRHRLFAVLDRTSLTFDPANPTRPGPRPYFVNTTATSDVGSSSLTVAAVNGTYDEADYAIRAGDQLVVDVGERREVVTVQTVTVATNVITLSAPLTKRHELGVPVTNVGTATQLGHPGPQRNFDPRNPLFGGVVRYFSVIQ